MEKEIWLKYRDRGLAVFGVNAGERDDPETAARRFVAENGVTYPTLLDADGAVMEAYQARAFPTVALVDRKGILRYLQAGFNARAVIQELEALLAEM